MTQPDQTLPSALLEAATRVRLNAHAPYSRFKVGAAIRAEDGQIYAGCNVENVAYPQGTCAEAGAIAAMVAAGAKEAREVLVIADSPEPIPPCGGCRQKLAEFAADDATIHMTTLTGQRKSLAMQALLPGAFGAAHMELDKEEPGA